MAKKQKITEGKVESLRYDGTRQVIEVKEQFYRVNDKMEGELIKIVSQRV